MKRDDMVRGICQQKYFDSTGFKEIGVGGSGFVYKIKKDSDEFAVKVVTDSKLIPRFQIELETTKSLAGRGAIAIIDDGSCDEYCYYIMPLMTPLNLYKFQNYNQIVAIIVKICGILSYFSEAGVFHRDIKPGNIVIDEDTDEVFLIDLGLVKNVYKASDLTQKNDRIGSLTFIAPERVRPVRNSDINTEKADVYSFGMTAWALLTEERLGFGGQYTPEDFHVSLNARGIDFRGISVIERVIQQCTAINPHQRPTFSEVNQELSSLHKINFHVSDFYSNSQFAFRQTKPDFVVWQEADDIARVLNNIIKRKYPLEILLHDADGWLNLDKVVISKKYGGMLEVYANSNINNPFLFDPSFLLLANFNDIPFYILESKIITPFTRLSGYDEVLPWLEPVCEIGLNRFTYEKCAEYNDFNGSDLPPDSRGYGLITQGRFMIKLIAGGTSILEQVWREDQNLLSIAFPLYEKRKRSKLRKVMRFVEPTNFKSRRVLLTYEQEYSIKALVQHICQVAATPKEQISADELNTFFSARPDADFLKSVCEIAQYTVNNFVTDPFYMPLDEALTIYNHSNMSVDYHIDRHPQHGIDFLLRKIYLFLFKYSEDSSSYLQGIRSGKLVCGGSHLVTNPPLPG